MIKTSTKTLFFTTIVIRTLIVLNSRRWIGVWTGLEINLISFIPLISRRKNSFNSQRIMIYFLIQSIASIIFITIILTNKYIYIFININIIKLLICIRIIIKIGIPPFHIWFPEIINKIKWNICVILITWQKIAPIYIIRLTTNLSKTLIILICLSSLVGAIGGVNQTSTRKILAYSSINHIRWIVACAATSKKSWTVYIIIYSLIIVIISLIIHEYNIISINQINIFSTKNIDKIIIIIIIMRIGGIPPFIGFIPKWITIQSINIRNEFILLIIMILSTIITLSYYLRISTTINIITSHSQKWIYFIYINKKISIKLIFINISLPTIIVLINFI